ncbi:uncharacterized protein LOC117344546 [Pecten maximus]|uniref:uncharacterized protein LOC117344546 n=1 Tax=Pecten maximus TaxID=6579 RepID=UPI0014587823|nr:uncharacterized protein LOC117344546 [Pecten maximus]
MAEVSPQDIRVLKCLAAPPQLVKDTLAAVMILIGEPNPRDYKTALRALSNKSDKSLNHRLSSLDVDTIAMEDAVKARGLVNGITKERIRSVCAAASGIFCWVQTVLSRVEERKGSLSTDKVDLTN